jgi:hypothetical protein
LWWPGFEKRFDEEFERTSQQGQKDSCTCRNRPLRFASGTGNAAGDTGHLEVQVSGSWATICDDGWDNNAAMAACRAMGFTDGGVQASHYSWAGPDATFCFA